MIEDDDYITTDEAIDAFVDDWIASGKSAVTARKYARYLWNIGEGFDSGIKQLTATETTRQETLSHFDENVPGNPSCLNSYKTAFRAYCKYANQSQAVRGRVDFALAPLPSGETWYRTYEVDDIEKFGRLLSPDDRFKNDVKWVFRGQGNDKWKLETSLGRVAYGNAKSGFGDALKSYERKSMWMFAREAYKDLEYRDFTGVNLLSLMQHYGCKTRLLDFSCSPFVALYVAIEQYEMNIGRQGFDDVSVALWAFDVTSLNKHGMRKEWEDYARLDFDNANRIVEMESNWASAGVSVVFPTICNRRISAQDGLFIMPNSLDYSFEVNLRMALQMEKEHFAAQKFSSICDFIPNCCGSMVKLVISADMIPEVKNLLNVANITARTVYPDLIGLGKHVGGLINTEMLRPLL